MLDPSIYRPYSRLVRIRILQREFEVPENNILLRCFQFIAPAVPYGPFCWNGDCENDRIRFREGAHADVVTGLSCQTLVKEGMEIVEISPDLARVLASALAPPGTADADPGEAGAAAASPLAGVSRAHGASD